LITGKPLNMPTYKIKSWRDRYENNRTRELKRLDWLPLPNRHDGEAYARLMLRADGPQIFAAWILLLQVASRCETRGTLTRDDGTPLDSESLAIRTRASKTLFEKSLPALVQMGWIETVEADATPIISDDSATGCDITASTCGVAASPCLEGKGKNGRKGAPQALAGCLDCSEFATAWEDWQAHRKSLRKPLTPQSISEQLKQFGEWGVQRSIEAIRHSIKNGWQGVFEPTSQQLGNRSPARSAI
jgi:hypothetical protein